MNEQTQKRIRVFLAVAMVLFAVLFLLRGICIDRDRASYGISLYEPVDEGIYSEMALDIYNNGGLSRGDYPMEGAGFTEPLMQTIVLNNLLIYGFIRLIGDNYYAMRLPTFLQALAIFILLMGFAWKKAKAAGFRSSSIWAVAAVGLLLLCDFHFLMASVTFESSLSRGLCVLLIWMIFSSETENTFKKFFFGAFVSVISVFFVYLSNVFLAFSGLAVILYYYLKRGKQEGLRAFWGYTAGGLVGMVPAELYYILVWHRGAIGEAFTIISAFGQNADHSLKSNPLVNLTHFFGAQGFFFNPALAGIVFLALVYILSRMIRKDQPESCFLIFSILGFVLMVAASSDYAERKYITVFPLMIIAVIELFIDAPELLRFAGLHKLRTALLLLFSVGMSGFCFTCGYLLRTNAFEELVRYIPAYKVLGESVNGQVYLWYFVTRAGVVSFSLFAVLMLCLFAYVCFSKQGKGWQKFVQTAAALTLVCSSVVNCFMCYRFYYTYDVYENKAICQQLGDMLGDQYLVGAYSLLYSYYNDVKVVCGDIPTTSKLMDYDEIQYYFDYGHIGYQWYMDIYCPHEIYTWKKIVDFPRSYTSGSGHINASEGLYIKVLKEAE